MKLNAFNCHLLKMNSIKWFSRTLSIYNPLWLVWIFRIPILENTYWWLLIYVLEALVFQNTSKWMLSSSSNQASFSSKYFYLKNHPEKHLPSFSPPWGEGIPSLLFIMFSSLLFTPHSSKTFLYWQNIKILIYLKRQF